MTREELLKDEWVKENFGGACYPNYFNPNFGAGVKYGERKAIEKAIDILIDMSNDGYLIDIHNHEEFEKQFRKIMEE